MDYFGVLLFDKAWCYYWLMRHKASGFTIVELLIVIVVIGVLAAITLVAYNGIQTRAENTKTTQAVAQYSKGVLMYATVNNIYPAYEWVCLAGTTSCGQIEDMASTCFGLGGGYPNAGFDTAVKTFISSNLPSVSNQKMLCGGKQYSGGFYVSAAPNKTAYFYYLLRGNQTCSVVSGTVLNYRDQLNDVTICSLRLPDL